MVYEIGSFIHDMRIERGYSQEELCYGICSTGNLSKIENGVRMPNRKTIEALMERLGCEQVFIQFSSREEMHQEQLCKRIVRKLTEKNFAGIEEMVSEFEESISGDDVLNSQYCRFTKTVIKRRKGQPAEETIREFRDILKMTKPGYTEEELMPKGLLTYTEIVILINIASSYIDRDNAKAIELLFELKKYMDTHVLDWQEKARKYQLIIFNLSGVLVDEKRYDEAIKMCDLGIENSKKHNRLRLLPYFFLNKGFALLGKNMVEQAQEQLHKGYSILDAMGEREECQRLLRYLKEKWNFKNAL